MTGYDIIGDIHGHSEPLERLLSKMGYDENGGVFRHPERRAVFLGDFIDRGPDQLRVLEIARRMVDAGAALAVMGNHEFNAISWLTPDGDGGWCRQRSEKNRNQHQSFLTQVGEDSADHREWIEWFRTLPMWLELDGLRVVHACWHSDSMDLLEGPLVTDEVLMAEREHPFHEATEILLKGPEIYMGGVTYSDKDGHLRDKARLKWWDSTATTIANGAVVPGGSKLSAALPDDRFSLAGFPIDSTGPPVLYGHYWRSGDTPEVDGPLTACLDWSIAKGGLLAAYRWSGETELANDNLVATR